MSAALVGDSARAVVARAGAHRWMIGGVAAELARRLRANVGLIRVLIVLALAIDPDVLFVYAAAALLIPRGDRRLARWSGLVALGRVGLVQFTFVALSPGLGVNETFEAGPSVWLVHGAVTVVALLLLLSAAPDADAIDEAACRRQVLLAAPVVALAAAGAAGVALVPPVRWEHVAVGAAVVAGALVAAGRASLPLAAALAAVVVFLAGAGIRLQGGIGDTTVTPDRGGEIQVRRAVGTIEVDLSGVREPVAVDASTGFGDLVIVVPMDATVTSRLHVGRGSLLATREAHGVDLRHDGNRREPPKAAFSLRVRADVGVGSLVIVRRSDGSQSRSDL